MSILNFSKSQKEVYSDWLTFGMLAKEVERLVEVVR
jgi:hypothetical protein